MFRKIVLALLLVLLLSACSLHRGPGQVSSWTVVVVGSVDHVSEDYVTVRFNLVSVMGIRSSDRTFWEWKDTDIPFTKVFSSRGTYRGGDRYDYARRYQQDDKVRLDFNGVRIKDASRLFDLYNAYVRNAQKSDLPPLVFIGNSRVR